MSEVFQLTYPKPAVSYACPSHYSGFKTKTYSHSPEDTNVLLLKGEKRRNMLALPLCLTWNPTKCSVSNFYYIFFSIPLEKCVFAVLSRKGSASWFRIMHVLIFLQISLVLSVSVLEKSIVRISEVFCYLI